ncbi:MAG: TonB-dependent receptor [Bryobacteraceae bacterium]|nr:TonB-dependent receptor [Bryobacteraceae bacterium]
MKDAKTGCLVAFLFLLTSVASAQITGELRGVVVDASEAAVAQARVILTNVATGVSREMATDNEGRLAFNLLPPGDYEVRAEAAGFRSTVTRAEVRTGEITSVRVALEVGQVTEVITVLDTVTPLDVENAQIQTGVVGESIQDIPVNRNPNLFALMAPGVAPVTANNPFLGSGSFNSNGGRGRGNNITVDGITATDVSVTGTGGVITPLNFAAIREVKLITNNFSAEYGRNSSSQLLYITKSGANALTGQLYHFLQNDKLNARPFFDRTGQTNIVRDNTWGFEVGGPVFLPRLVDWRNRFFWHASYEGQKVRGAGEARIGQVPTQAMLNQVTDPTSRALLDQYQLPAAENDAGSFGQVQQGAATTTDLYKMAVRTDVHLTDRDLLWVRYSRAKVTQGSTGLTFIGSNLANFGATSENLPQQATIAETHLFSPTLVNEFRFGFGRSTPAFPINSTVPLGPRIRFLNGQVSSFGVWEGLPQGRLQNTFQYTNNLSWVRRAHNLKFGFEGYRLQANSFFDALQRPLIDFNNWDDFASGTPFRVQQRFGSSVRGNRVTNLFGFAQDDWKATRNLTLNLGVRWEMAGGVNEVNGLISNLNLDCREPVGIAGSGPFGCFTIGEASFRTNHNWAPRVGFAYSPRGSQRTVIRGGYGISYDFVFLNPVTNQRFLPPFIITGDLQGVPNFTGANSFANIVAGTSALQTATATQVGQIATNVRNFGNVSPAIDQGLKNPQVHQFSFGVQRELPLGLVGKATYVGTKGNFLLRTRSLNLIANPPAPAVSVADETARLSQFQQAVVGSTGGATAPSNRFDPRYNNINFIESSAGSIYHSGQFEVQKRFAQGYFFTAAYTVSKSIDDGSDVLGVLINDDPGQQNPLNARAERAPSQYDLPQRLVLTHSWEPTWWRNHGNRFVRHVMGGWGFSGISSFRSGFPVTLESGPRRGVSPLTVTGVGGAPVRPNAAGSFEFSPRPAGSAGAPSGTVNPDGVQAISAYAASLGLSQPLLGNFGMLGRNRHRLNGQTHFDWNFYKSFAITEQMRLQFRGELYNVFNNTSFQDVNRNISNSAFGQYTTTANLSRFLQFGLRLVF